MNVNLMDFGVSLIIYLQSVGQQFTGLMKLFSFFGQEEFFLLVMPVLYWCIDASLGLRIGLMLLISNGLNGILKIAFHGPRPYFYSSHVQALASETSFGAPSAHAQNAAAVWGLLAALVRRKWLWAIIVPFIFMIGLSRIFLGVHFPSDVIFGWVIGAALVWAFNKMEPVVKERLLTMSQARQLGLVFVFSLALILLGALAKLSLGAWSLPAQWLDTIALTDPGGEPIAPLALSDIILSSGAFFGLAAGVILLASQGGFNARGSWIQRSLRYPVGLAGVALLYFGLGVVFPRGESLIPYILRFLRYALVGVWISALAPLIFMRLGLANQPPDHQKTVSDAWRTHPSG